MRGSAERSALGTRASPRQRRATSQHVSLADALELCLLYRGDPERYERAAAGWIARLIAERPEIHLAEMELAAAGFREAVHSERGVDALRGCRKSPPSVVPPPKWRRLCMRRRGASNYGGRDIG